MLVSLHFELCCAVMHLQSPMKSVTDLTNEVESFDNKHLGIEV